MTTARHDPPVVALVCMPWATAAHPSLALSLLQARLEAVGILTQSLYANLRFAEAVGVDRYERYGFFDSIFSQYVFSELLFGRIEPDGPAFSEFMARRGVSPGQLDELQAVKALVPSLVDWCMAAVDWTQVRIAGFTTTFMQTLPSLALARCLRARFPHLRIVLGGAGCQGEMGLAIYRNFRFVDGVCLGEGEDVIVGIAEAVLRGTEPSLPGLLWRSGNGSDAPTGHPRPIDMRRYRSPEFRDYFRQRDEIPAIRRGPVMVPFEASRGCWWGAIRHCRFCGLNGELMAQRARPLPEVVAELAGHRRRHGATLFLAADNILARDHIDAIVPLLREHLPGANLFFEVRVTMRRHQLRALAEAGVRTMQPGIESLIPEVLQLVDKGTTPMLNLVFLRRAVEFGITVDWNLMCGLPGERSAWYDSLLTRLPRFYHLPPPDVVRFGLQRFSPYFERPAEHGIAKLRAMPGSAYIWDLPESEIMALSFEWSFALSDREQDESAVARLEMAVDDWQSGSFRLTAELTSVGRVVISDTRPGAPEAVCVLSLPRSRLLRTLEQPVNCRGIQVLLARHQLSPGPALAADLAWLVERGYIYAERTQFAALTVPADPAGFWLAAEACVAANPRVAVGVG